MKNFLNVLWENLLVVNYRMAAGSVAMLEEHLPPGTELDDFHGEHYVSVVAFEFKKTRILGIPSPFYRNFAEINLRFYVRRKVGNEWRRGVVFIKEIAPNRLPALIANVIFKENFHVHPLKCVHDGDSIAYRWKHNGEEQEISTACGDCFELPEKGSLTEHVIDHFWAYKKFTPTSSGEFQVSHSDWQVQDCPEAKVEIDLTTVYGEEWTAAMGEPVSVFLADGSQVGVTKPKKFKPAPPKKQLKPAILHPIPDGLF
ncbi:MAG: YqjF family protein [Akkermansiaceae bacterium]